MNSVLRHPWICPFCPLHCEDVKIERQTDGVRSIAPDCSLAQAAINRLELDRTQPRAARVGGNIVDWQAAIQEAAERLSQAGAIAIRGSLSGLGAARSALGFAERVGAAIDHDAGETQNAMRRTIAREGVFSATLGDVRRYADLVIFIGRPEENFPRLVERFFGDGLVESRSRRIVSIDLSSANASRHPRTSGTQTAATLTLPVAAEQFSDFLAAVRRHTRGRTADEARGLDEQTTDQLRKFSELLDAANYVAVVVAPTALDSFGPLGAEVEAATLLASVAMLNKERRAVLLSIDPSHSFRQAALWRAGFSGPVLWHQGVPGLLERGQFDAFWESPGTTRLRIECSPDAGFASSGCSGREGKKHGESAPASIVLSVEGASEAAVHNAAVFLPIAAPGIDLPDAVVRGDGTVTLPLKPVRSSQEPSLAETLIAISEAGRFPTDTSKADR